MTFSAFADHIGVTPAVITRLVQRGILERAGKGLDLDRARLAYCAHLRSLAGNGSGDPAGDYDLGQERARLAREQADALEMKNAVTRGDLLVREDVDAAVTAAFARVRARLLAIPGKLAPVLLAFETPAEAQQAMRDAVHEALRELSETAVADLTAEA